MDTRAIDKMVTNERLLNIVCNGIPEPKIAVIGVGGAGNNIVNNIQGGCRKNVHTIAINTDEKALKGVNASTKLLLGKDVTQGRGTNGFPEVGEYCAECAKKAIRDAVVGHDIAFVIAGMGGGTGTGMAPVVARTATELHCLTFVIAINPFTFERERTEKAQEGVRRLREITPNAIVLENDLLLKVAENLPLHKAFEIIDRNVMKLIESFCSKVTQTFMEQFQNEIDQWLRDNQSVSAPVSEPEIVIAPRPVACEMPLEPLVVKTQLPQ
jgi:cell division protein FtsZ